jgi:hypothetical protein
VLSLAPSRPTSAYTLVLLPACSMTAHSWRRGNGLRHNTASASTTYSPLPLHALERHLQCLCFCRWCDVVASAWPTCVRKLVFRTHPPTLQAGKLAHTHEHTQNHNTHAHTDTHRHTQTHTHTHTHTRAGRHKCDVRGAHRYDLFNSNTVREIPHPALFSFLFVLGGVVLLVWWRLCVCERERECVCVVVCLSVVCQPLTNMSVVVSAVLL